MSDAIAFPSISSRDDRRADDRLIACWLLAVAAMIFAMVVIGGITRLTESGLSITEWQPVSGVVPPLTEAAWQHEFDLYKRVPEFQKLRPDMTLAEFKGIFWWEYVHRLWGRLIGLAFALPGLWLLWRGRVRPELRPRLIGLFALGALQGALGWFMVESGLSVRTDVSQYRLVAHLLVALTIYAAMLWTAFGLIRPQPRPLPGAAGLRRHALALLVLIVGMLTTGGFTAGLDGGKIYNTFPLMGGGLVPGDLLALEPLWRNPFENPTAAQFIHRWLAMVVAGTSLALWLRRGLLPSDARLPLHLVAGMTAIQVSLGISTLLLVVPVPLAATHQAGAVLLLSVTLYALHSLRGADAPAS
ncbi:MAG TPA: COX15/CtaA family protein [Dongiaceae bacterium]|nr:COX15/CtaA family protein [Dongiaceae bacterium]